MQIYDCVPFLAVRDMRQSLAFYLDGLGFTMENSWEPEGEVRWCLLRLGGSALMLQQHEPGKFQGAKGEGATLCFFMDDAVGFYRAITARGIEADEPFVGNRLWVTELEDPDGYRLMFESPTTVTEETKLSQLG